MKKFSCGRAIWGARLAGLPVAPLVALVAASVLIHGYHYGIEDEAIYLPAIKAHLNPALYPHDAIYFQLQTRPMLFDDLVAYTARWLHLAVDWTVFAFYLGSLLAFYAGAWALQSRLFPGTRAGKAGNAALPAAGARSGNAALPVAGARSGNAGLPAAGAGGGVLLVAALLTLPVAGTCVFLADQHLHPRTLATALILLAAARLAPRAWGEQLAVREYGWAALLMAAAAAMHPQMAFYGALLLGVLWLPERALRWQPALVAGAVAALLLALAARWMGTGGAEWQEASRTRTQHYLLQWEWYEWLGGFAPVFVLWGMGWLARRRGLAAASAVAKRTAWLAAAGFVAGCAITIPPRMERLTPFQPLRTLHLVYLVMTLLAGGLLGEIVLKDKLWRWAVLLLPIAAGMSYAQFDSFPDSHHVEWPGRATGNDWVEAFNWVKGHTPVDAYFAMDPHYMELEGEDYHGFRGLAERGQMADWDKDPGVALLFPALVTRWSHEVHTLDNWDHFTAQDLHRLREQFGVDWTVVRVKGEGAIALSDCPYRNRRVVVCRIE
jgi:hypothetical protein